MSTETAAEHGEIPQASAQNLRLLENIEVKLTVEVGGTRITIRDLLKLNEGSIVELDRLAGEHLDILVNGTLLAKGEIVLVGESLGIRFTEIISPEQRLRSI
jgi:flagellar motor switch protein FliN